MALSEKQQEFVLRCILKSRINLSSMHIFKGLLEARGLFPAEDGIASQKDTDQFIDFLFKRGVIERKHIKKDSIWIPTMYLSYIVHGLRELPQFEAAEYRY
jgi:hypothetical protein